MPFIQQQGTLKPNSGKCENSGAASALQGLTACLFKGGVKALSLTQSSTPPADGPPPCFGGGLFLGVIMSIVGQWTLHQS